MKCAEQLRLQAFFDGELDAESVVDVERHAATCPVCSTRLEELAQERAQLRHATLGAAPPAALRDRIRQALDQEDRTRSLAPRPAGGSGSRAFWVGLSGGAVGGAVAASLAFLILSVGRAGFAASDLVANHTRALLSSHLVDVVSTDQHTVKPWFAGRTDVSPALADFAAQGYRLLGGRVDYLAHQRAAVVVYQHGAHVIDVSGWVVETDSVPADTSRNGYHLAFWQVGNVRYCAVSDTGWSELRGLVRLLKGIN